MKSVTVSGVGLALIGVAQAGVITARQGSFRFECNGQQYPDVREECFHTHHLMINQRISRLATAMIFSTPSPMARRPTRSHPVSQQTAKSSTWVTAATARSRSSGKTTRML
ncbi:predicted protein [Plenodomus lingam JN3]|uniref:Uncharacterized protein n=1 Tax=Leptosphaeria maculans (strain JN3 / isolate v23.1.3 / race Av1-4-5-6-7-8) TaxID=985895 RepID=E5A6V8_LEPMJ|nr:predicted protein [Plenodomus lingam JN3]CBX99353.1 predicted protein [Plenodomus lingam JN3]